MSSSVLDHPPSRLARLPFYYGWVNLLVASVAMSATLPGRTHGLGLITTPLLNDPALGLDESRLSLMNLWAILLGAAACYPIGRMIDRFGVRVCLVAASLTLGAAVIAMSRANDAITLFLTLTLVRGLGQGALTVVSMAIVGKWFARRIGVAMGVFSVLLAIGFIATTLGTGAAVQSLGWRPAWFAVGVSLAMGLAPLGVLLVRDLPESIGASVDALPQTSAPLDVPLLDALRRPAFWAFTLATALFNLAWSAIMLFNENILAERGFDQQTFLIVMAVLTAAGLPANLLCGWLAGRWPMGRLLAIGMLAFALSLAAFPWLSTPGEAIAYAACLGVGGGIITVIFFAVYGHAFGRQHLGSIQATVQVLMVLASAAGPVLLTWSKDATGSYAAFFTASSVAAVALAAIVWMVRLPPAVKEPKSQSERCPQPTD